MATTTSSSPPISVDPQQASSSIQSTIPPVNNHTPSAFVDANSISPYSFYQPYSSSRSPSNFDSSSDNGGPSDFDDYYALDEYNGVNFDIAAIPDLDQSLAAVQDIHLSEKTANTHPYLSEASMTGQSSKAQLATQIQSATSSKTDIASPIESSQLHEPSVQMTVSENEPLANYDGARLATMAPIAIPAGAPKLQLTPVGDNSHIDRPMSQGHPAQVAYSPRFTITPWGSGEERDLHAESDFEDEDAVDQPEIGAEPQLDRSSVWKTEDDATSSVTLSQVPSFQYQTVGSDSDLPNNRRGLEPERRKSVSAIEVPNFKDQERSDELTERIRQVEKWRSQARNAGDVEQTSARPRTAIESTGHGDRRSVDPVGSILRDDIAIDLSYPAFPPTPQQSKDPDEGKGIEPVSDAASIRENRIHEGQAYFNVKAREIVPRDLDLLAQPRHFHDPPTFAQALKRQSQPDTANAAIAKYNEAADTYSVLSRQATWGTRRRSEPSLADIESIKNGNFIKRLSFGREKKEKKPGIFKEFANTIVRKKSDASTSKLKRFRPDVAGLHTRKENQSKLAPPSLNEGSHKIRPDLPRLDASVGAHPHLRRAHSGSSSISASSPSGSKSNLISNVSNALRRARSKSDFSRRPESEGLVELWRSSGGPPVPTLASPPVDSDESKPFQNNDVDVGEEEDDDDEPVDDGEGMNIESASPVSPNFMGFRQHALALNPSMERSYLVDRIAHQQVVRYKALLNARIRHSGAISDGKCAAGSYCILLGGAPIVLDPRGHLHNSATGNGLQVLGDIPDSDANPEGQLGKDSFPPGVPLPPVSMLPAEFECQLCFKIKKFQKPSDWTKHVHEDVQPFTCTYLNCRESKSFKRKADWVRHENERHRHLEWWACQLDDCRHICYRKDNFLQHLVREHKLPEPKDKTKAAVKMASGEDEEVWALVRACHHESQARPQDEPCKFCGRSFSSWKKLTVHLAKHMEHVSLPVLGLIEKQSVNGDTIISPVDPQPGRPAPLTPVTMGRELSASSGLWTSSTGLSPAIPLGPQFLAAGQYRSSPSSQDFPQFIEQTYDANDVYTGLPSAQTLDLNSPVPVTQNQQQQSMFTDDELSFHAFDRIDPGTNPQQSAFTGIGQAPRAAQSQRFSAVSGSNFVATHQQNRHPTSYPGSNIPLSSESATFRNVHHQTPSFHGQPYQTTTTPNVTFAPQNMTNYATYHALGPNGSNAIGLYGIDAAATSTEFAELPMAQNINPGFMAAGPQDTNAGLTQQPRQILSQRMYTRNAQGTYGYHI